MTTSSNPENLKDLYAKLKPLADDMAKRQKWINDIVNTYTNIGNQTFDYVNKIATSIVNSSTKEMFKIADYFEKLEKQYRITEKEAIRILRRYKWVISFSMTEDFIFEVVSVTRIKGDHHTKINNLFINYFSKDNYKELSNLIRPWKNNSLFRNRIKILQDCVNTLKIRKSDFNPSNVVLPTLISQIDGVLSDYMKKIGVKKDKNKNWRKDLKNQLIDKEMPEFSDLANDLLLEILFQNSEKGKPLKIPFYFNRHKIMHGEFTKYGRLDNTLRAFLILDYLNFISSSNK